VKFLIRLDNKRLGPIGRVEYRSERLIRKRPRAGTVFK